MYIPGQLVSFWRLAIASTTLCITLTQRLCLPRGNRGLIQTNSCLELLDWLQGGQTKKHPKRQKNTHKKTTEKSAFFLNYKV